MPGSHKLGGSPQIDLTLPLLDEIYQKGVERVPAEACGVLLVHPRFRDNLRSQVVELPNRSMTPHDSYDLHTSDIRLELSTWIEMHSREEVEAMAIWHTHPAGNIGPSSRDMRSRLEGIAYLVVAITEAGPVPTWF